jgi:7-carboxy-7-deazaguanine synthase
MSDTLLVDEMFYSIQTEGVFAGRPAFFVRLHGCNLRCAFCDTMQDKEKAVKMTPKEITKKAKEIGRGDGLVVLTGGEPLLQNVKPLIDRFIKKGYYVQLETNGTVCQDDLPFGKGLYAVVSPKVKAVHPELIKHGYAFKYSIIKGMQDVNTGLPKGVWQDLKGNDRKKIMVSPVFCNHSVDTADNIAEAVAICKKFGYYLSVQYHKLIQGIK